MGGAGRCSEVCCDILGRCAVVASAGRPKCVISGFSVVDSGRIACRSPECVCHRWQQQVHMWSRAVDGTFFKYWANQGGPVSFAFLRMHPVVKLKNVCCHSVLCCIQLKQLIQLHALKCSVGDFLRGWRVLACIYNT